MKNFNTILKKTILFFGVLFFITPTTHAQNISTTETERVALLDTLINQTMRWRPWSPTKPSNVSEQHTYRISARKLEAEFRNANTNQKLARALSKLSNLRHDTHLKIEKYEDSHGNLLGMDYDDSEKETLIRFAPDFSKEIHSFFVKDISATHTNQINPTVKVGDKLTKVNGVEIEDYITSLDSNIRYSTINFKRWKLAEYLSVKSELFDPVLYKEDNKVTYTLVRNNIPFDVTLEYTKSKTNYRSNTSDSWLKIGNPTFYGFEKVISNKENYELYVYKTSPKVLLINWWGFTESYEKGTTEYQEGRNLLDDELEDLIEYAEKRGYLDNDVIFYAPFSHGGSGSPKLVRLLTNRAFKTTFGNVKISDATHSFLRYSGLPDSVQTWIQKGIDQKSAFTSNEPFKLLYFPEGSDGIMQPAPTRFTGNVVGVFSSMGGSNLDQCNAMIKDNGLMVTIGNPTGGFSKTYIYNIVPRCGADLTLVYSWVMGQSIRPNQNSEVLEGNPATPNISMDLTRENYLTYWDDLIDEAWNELAKVRSTANCGTGLIISQKNNRYLSYDESMITDSDPFLWEIEPFHTTENSRNGNLNVLVRNPNQDKSVGYIDNELTTHNKANAPEQWQMISSGNYFKFYNQSEQIYWDADSDQHNYRVDGSSTGDDDDQEWAIDCRDIPRTAHIKNVHYNKFLQNDSDNNVVIGTQSKEWQFEFLRMTGDGYFMVHIRDPLTNRFLDYDERDDNVDTSDNSGGDEKEWILQPIGNGQYHIINADDIYYLDAEGSGHNYNVDADEHRGSDNSEHEERKWMIIKQN